MSINNNIADWLKTRNNFTITLITATLAFMIYGCMYGIRKPFTAAEFKGISLWNIDYKAILIISQVIGYSLSKFIGIKVISEMKRSYRAIYITAFLTIAEAALFFFSIIPTPLNIIMLLINGIPLGMIWGLVFSYLEGRKTTEILGTILSISFIVSSGFVKSTGKALMDKFNLSEFQMPWVTGLLFLIPAVCLVWILDKTPDPSRDDEEHRTKRLPMSKIQRKKIFLEFAPGLILLTVSYILLTIFRDLRDNFTPELWKAIGNTENPMIYTWSELPIAFIVLGVMSSMMLIRDNRKALLINILLIFTGFLTIGLSSIALSLELIRPAHWIILIGLGTYLGYLPFNCLLFDRLIAAFGSAANAGFFIYIADSFGYLGSVGTLIFKNLSNKTISWYSFLNSASYWLALSGGVLIIISFIYFNYKIRIKSAEMKTIPVIETSSVFI
jgi:MFS family permease